VLVVVVVVYFFIESVRKLLDTPSHVGAGFESGSIDLLFRLKFFVWISEVAHFIFTVEEMKY